MAKASAWLLAATIAGAALAVGTVHTATLCVVTAGLAVAAVLGWWDAEPARMRPAATVLLLTGVTLTAYTAAQCIPMPIGWLAVLAPHNADVWSRALAPLHEAGPRWAPLSLDPTATRVEALKGVAYLLAFVTSLRVARRRRGAGFLASAIVVTGVALAIAALLHPAFGARKLYGLWEPSFEYDRHLAPFLNPNNLASYLNIALCLAFAASLAPEPRVPRPILATIVVLLAATQVWVASRGGVGTMILGALLIGIISRAGRVKGAQTLATVSLLAGLAVTAGAFMLVLGGSEDASAELFVTDASKLDLVRDAFRLLPACPIFGVGRGAFETAFPAFRHTLGYVTFAYPENVIAQWVLEWGVPLGLGGLVALAYGLRPNAVLARSQTAAGAWAAVVVVAVQNLVDLGSEIAGLALAAVVCGAIVVGGSAGRRTRWRIEDWGKAPRVVAVGSAVAAAIAIVAAAAGLGTSVDDDRTALRNATLEIGHGPTAIHARARAAMLRHPGEPYIPFVPASRAARARDDDPMVWIGATLERAPVYGPAHLLLARLVASRAPSQARLEFRLAMQQSPELAGPALAEAPRWIGGFDDAMELVPEGPLGTQVLEALAQRLQLRLPATCVRLDGEHAARAPTDPGPALRLAEDAVDDLQGEGAPWCQDVDRPACLKRALATARRAELLAPSLCAGYALHARAEVANGDVAGGLKELSEASDTVSERVECLQSLVSLANRMHDDQRTSDALARIAKAGCSDDADCARNLAWIAAVEEQRGNALHARVLYKQAYERAPDQDALLEALARLAAAGGLHAEAADDYDRLTQRHPEDARWRKAAESEHDAAMKAAMRL